MCVEDIPGASRGSMGVQHPVLGKPVCLCSASARKPRSSNRVQARRHLAHNDRVDFVIRNGAMKHTVSVLLYFIMC